MKKSHIIAYHSNQFIEFARSRVLAGLLISVVAIYIFGSVEQHYPTEPLVFSLENATVILVHDTEWARGK